MTPLPIAAKYGHTNIIAHDWHALAAFYQEVFGCVPVPPERDFHGAPIEAATGLPGPLSLLFALPFHHRRILLIRPCQHLTHHPG